MSKYRKGDKVVSKVNSPGVLTSGKAYTVSQTGHTFTRIKDDNNREFRLVHERFEHHFEALKEDHLPVNLRTDDFLKDLGYKRIANPSCTCGAWSLKDSGHSHWCDSLVDDILQGVPNG